MRDGSITRALRLLILPLLLSRSPSRLLSPSSPHHHSLLPAQGSGQADPDPGTVFPETSSTGLPEGLAHPVMTHELCFSECLLISPLCTHCLRRTL